MSARIRSWRKGGSALPVARGFDADVDRANVADSMRLETGGQTIAEACPRTNRPVQERWRVGRADGMRGALSSRLEALRTSGCVLPHVRRELRPPLPAWPPERGRQTLILACGRHCSCVACLTVEGGAPKAVGPPRGHLGWRRGFLDLARRRPCRCGHCDNGDAGQNT